MHVCICVSNNKTKLFDCKINYKLEKVSFGFIIRYQYTRYFSEGNYLTRSVILSKLLIYSGPYFSHL